MLRQSYRAAPPGERYRPEQNPAPGRRVLPLLDRSYAAAPNWRTLPSSGFFEHTNGVPAALSHFRASNTPMVTGKYHIQRGLRVIRNSREIRTARSSACVRQYLTANVNHSPPKSGRALEIFRVDQRKFTGLIPGTTQG